MTKDLDNFNALMLKRKSGRKDVDDFDRSKIFNDDYFITARTKYVKDGVTPQEFEMYSNKTIRKVYASFEQLIMDNIQYYDRIIRTVFFLFENRMVHEGRSYGHIENPYVKMSRKLYKNKITPTELYYIAMLPPDFLFDEFTLAYPDVVHGVMRSKKLAPDKRAVMFACLHANHNRFKLLHELARTQTGSNTSDSYSSVLSKDLTSYKFLKTILPYQYQKAIQAALSGLADDSEEFKDTYTSYVNILNKFGKNLPDQHTSLRSDALHFYDMKNKSWVYYSLSNEYNLSSAFPFPETVINNYKNFRKWLDCYEINTKFLEQAMCEMLKNRDTLSKFYGIKSLSNGSVSSVRLISAAGAGIHVKETMFDSKGQVVSEEITFKLKKIERVAEVIINQLNYYVFDVDKPNVINTNLKDPEDVLKHITEVVERFQSATSELHDKYNEEVDKVMQEYIKEFKQKEENDTN